MENNKQEYDIITTYLERINKVHDIAPNLFFDSIYGKAYKEQKKNLREKAIIMESIERSLAIKYANEEYKSIKNKIVLLGGCNSRRTITRKHIEGSLIFIFSNDKITIYKSKYKWRTSYFPIAWGVVPGAIALVDSLTIQKLREKKSLKKYTLTREEFLSKITYNPKINNGEILDKNNDGFIGGFLNSFKGDSNENNWVSFDIELDGEFYKCDYLYQPYLHLFLYMIENGYNSNLTTSEIQHAILRKYLYNAGEKKYIINNDKISQNNNIYNINIKKMETNMIQKNQNKFNEYGYDNEGYNREGFDIYGYDREGYNREGYNKKGYNRNGFNTDGYNYAGYDKNGYDKNGYTHEGYDVNGFNTRGFDKNGINKNTGTKYNEEGYDVNGFDENGFTKYGFDKNGINKNTKTEYDKKGFNTYGINKETGTIKDKKGNDREHYYTPGCLSILIIMISLPIIILMLI